MIWAAVLLAGAQTRCAPASAIMTTPEEMASEPSKWFDRCVRVNGYASEHTFYSGPKGFYRYRASDAEGHPNDGWLGLYFEESDEFRKPFSYVSLIGKVESCVRSYERAAAAAEPDTIVMSVGYCHYNGGLILKQVQVLSRKRTAAFDRQTGEEARAAFGDLEWAKGINVPPEAEDFIDQFRRAFAAGDRGQLLRLVSPYDVEFSDRPKETARYAAFLAGEWGPLASWREFRQLPEPTWFHTKRSRDGDEAGDWFACFCRGPDCARDWPIAEKDTALADNLPYLCLRAYEGFENPRDFVLGVSVGSYWDSH